MCDTHDGRAVCWRCSDAVAWWAEARGGPVTCNCHATPLRRGCSVPGCSQPLRTMGLCQQHYYQARYLKLKAKATA